MDVREISVNPRSFEFEMRHLIISATVLEMMGN